MDRDPCGRCGSTTYSRWRKVYPGTDDKKQPYEECNKCGKVGAVKTYDDMYKGDCGNGLTTDPNLCDPNTGKEIPYSTPSEKAAIMKQLNVKQAPSAERTHGSRNETKRRTYFT